MSQVHLSLTKCGYNEQAESDGYGPVKGTLSSFRIGMIWLAANLVVTTLLTGTLFVPGVAWHVALSLIIIGTVIGASVLVLVGNMGTRTGLSTMGLTKGAFGLRGAYATSMANVIILMGWSWVQAILAGVTVNYLSAQLFDFSNPVLFSVLCQLLVVGLAIFGHAGIARVEPWLAFVILAIIAYVFFIAFSNFSFAQFEALPINASLGWNEVAVLDVVIATAISWTVLSAEFNRLAKSQKAGVLGSGVGYVISTVLSMSLGATLMGYLTLQGNTVNGFDPIEIVNAFGIPLAMAIFLSVIATNTMVVYGMVSSVINLTPNRKWSFMKVALVIGAISVAGSSWLAMLDKFTEFLTLIGALFVPVFAIMIADYYWLKKASYHQDILLGKGGRYWYQKGVNLLALSTWLGGFLFSLWLVNMPNNMFGVTLPTFIFSFVAYIGSMKSKARLVGEGAAH